MTIRGTAGCGQMLDTGSKNSLTFFPRSMTMAQPVENSLINSALFTDFYELTMANGYWKNNMNQKVVFDMFFRRNPFNGGFSVLAGNETLMDYILNFRFSEQDISYLAEQNIFEKGFLDYLKDFKFSGDLYTMDEG